jgi:hypothetical protein
MTPGNLAVVFAPLVLRARVENINQMMRDSKTVTIVTELMITFQPEIFAVRFRPRKSFLRDL